MTDIVSVAFKGDHMFYKSLSKSCVVGNEWKLFDTYLERYFGLVQASAEFELLFVIRLVTVEQRYPVTSPVTWI